MEDLEEKLRAQISGVRKQSDQLRVAGCTPRNAWAREADARASPSDELQAKVSNVETACQTEEVQTRLSRLEGAVRQLSSSAASAGVLRAPIEGLHTRLVEAEAAIQQVSTSFGELRASSTRAAAESVQAFGSFCPQLRRLEEQPFDAGAGPAGDEALRAVGQRLQRLEQFVLEQAAGGEELRGHLDCLSEHCARAEEAAAGAVRSCAAAARRGAESREGREGFGGAGRCDLAAGQAALEARVSDACRGLGQLQGEARDVRLRLEAQEERLRALRAASEAREEQMRRLSDRLDRPDVETRLREVQAQVAEQAGVRLAQGERLEAIRLKFEQHLNACEALGTTPALAPAPATPALPAGADAAACSQAELLDCALSRALGETLASCDGRLAACERRLQEVGEAVGECQAAAALGADVAVVAERVRQLGPQVAAQEECLTGVFERVGRLEVVARMGGAREAAAMAAKSAAKTAAAAAGGLAGLAGAGGAAAAARPFDEAARAVTARGCFDAVPGAGFKGP